MIREAIEYLMNKGEEENLIIELNEGTFSKKNLVRIEEKEIDTLNVTTLTSVIDFLQSNRSELKTDLLIHIESPTRVKLYGELSKDGFRNNILTAEALLPKNIRYDNYLDTEMFNIMLQSSFIDNNDKELLLKFTGLIKEENVRETGDDGISQSAVVKTGIASVGEAKVPNPVILKPYRTFTEIEQVESKFIFRMKDGPSAALIEADGGAWKNEAMNRIKEYLVENTKGLKVEIIA